MHASARHARFVRVTRLLLTGTGLAACLLLVLPRLASVPGEAAGSLVLVSVSSSGAQGNGASQNPSISGDGRYVAFQSAASNLVAGDTNGRRDIFVHDLPTGSTTRVSVASNGAQASGSSQFPSISGDGRSVAFQSGASNLVPGDTNGRRDIFVHDLLTGSTRRVSVSSTGAQANGHSYRTAISDDGRSVAFESDASNLVSDDTNGLRDVFVHDLQTGTTTRVTVSSTGAQANSGSLAFSISGNGRYVAFESAASNLVAGDTNGVRDIFVHDLLTGSTVRANVRSSGAQANASSENPSMAFDRYVAFESHAYNLVDGDTNRLRDIFVHDLPTGSTTRVSVGSNDVQADSGSEYSSISGDGRYVAFRSDASSLAAGAADGLGHIYVRDLQTGSTIVVAADPTGPHSDASRNFIPHMSADGRSVTFESSAPALVADDANAAIDIFVSRFR